MNLFPLRTALSIFALLPLTTSAAQSPLVVNLDVPDLATAGSSKGFEFASFQFNTYLVGIGDPSGSSDYAANVLGEVDSPRN